MTSLPAIDPDTDRLRAFIAQLSECQTTDERDQALNEVMGEVAKILAKRPAFERH